LATVLQPLEIFLFICVNKKEKIRGRMHQLIKQLPDSVFVLLLDNLEFVTIVYSCACEHPNDAQLKHQLNLVFDHLANSDPEYDWKLLKTILKMHHDDKSDLCPAYRLFFELFQRHPNLLKHFSNRGHMRHHLDHLKLVIAHDHVQILEFLLNQLIENNLLTDREITMLLDYAKRHSEHVEISQYLNQRFVL
jgi:hypothetical protein